MTDHIKAYAQYIADSIDVTILLKRTVGDVDEAEAIRRTEIFLRDEGWQGRTYPLDFFRMDTVLL